VTRRLLAALTLAALVLSGCTSPTDTAPQGTIDQFVIGRTCPSAALVSTLRGAPDAEVLLGCVYGDDRAFSIGSTTADLPPTPGATIEETAAGHEYWVDENPRRVVVHTELGAIVIADGTATYDVDELTEFAEMLFEHALAGDDPAAAPLLAAADYPLRGDPAVRSGAESCLGIQNLGEFEDWLDGEITAIEYVGQGDSGLNRECFFIDEDDVHGDTRVVAGVVDAELMGACEDPLSPHLGPNRYQVEMCVDDGTNVSIRIENDRFGYSMDSPEWLEVMYDQLRRFASRPDVLADILAGGPGPAPAAGSAESACQVISEARVIADWLGSPAGQVIVEPLGSSGVMSCEIYPQNPTGALSVRVAGGCASDESYEDTPTSTAFLTCVEGLDVTVAVADHSGQIVHPSEHDIRAWVEGLDPGLFVALREG
jgi:hypothetical protein